MKILIFLAIFLKLSNGQIKDKLVVITGSPSEEARKTEIVDLSDNPKTCSDLSDFPLPAYGSSGALVNDETGIICGGNSVGYEPRVKDCYKLDGSKVARLIEPRFESRSLPVQDALWVIGGSTSGTTKVRSFLGREIGKKLV